MTKMTAKIAAIVGPTAAGKTSLAVRLRRMGLPIEVVCCDALQLVRHLDAATAKPTAAEREAVPHHLVDILEPTEVADAGSYARRADAAISAIAARGGWPVLVGGTGLYLRAVVRGLAELPSSSPPLRAALEREAATLGLEVMHARLQAIDPVYAAATPAANRQRVLRALEVAQLSGRPFSAFHADHAAEPDRYRCATIVIEPERSSHLAHLTARAAHMAPALMAEVAALLAAGLSPTAPGMQALGYRQAAAYFERTSEDLAEPESLERSEPSEQAATVETAAPAATHDDQITALADVLSAGHRRYAKRQRTWFRRTEAALRVVDPQAEAEKVAAVLQAWFGST